MHALELAGCQCPLVWPTKEGEIWSRRLRNVPHQSHGPLRGSSKPHWKSSPNMELTARARSEEQTSELQSLMRTSYAVCCLKKKICPNHNTVTGQNSHPTFHK